MIYITGDMHGDSARLDAAGRKLKKDDILLVCGISDFCGMEEKRKKNT